MLDCAVIYIYIYIHCMYIFCWGHISLLSVIRQQNLHRQDIAVQSCVRMTSFFESRGADQTCEVLSRTVGSRYNCDIFLGRCSCAAVLLCPSLCNKGVCCLCAGDCSEKNGPPVGQDHGSSSEGCGRRQRWSEICA